MVPIWSFTCPCECSFPCNFHISILHSIYLIFLHSLRLFPSLFSLFSLSFYPYTFVNFLYTIRASYYFPHFNPLFPPSPFQFYSHLILLCKYLHSCILYFLPFLPWQCTSPLLIFPFSGLLMADFVSFKFSFLVVSSLHHSIPLIISVVSFSLCLCSVTYHSEITRRHRIPGLSALKWRRLKWEATEIPWHPSTLYRHSKLFGVNSDTYYTDWHVGMHGDKTPCDDMRDAIHIRIEYSHEQTTKREKWFPSFNARFLNHQHYKYL